MFPLDGDVTARANPTAHAASIAFPPFFNIVTPISDAYLGVYTTIPFSETIGSWL